MRDTSRSAAWTIGELAPEAGSLSRAAASGMSLLAANGLVQSPRRNRSTVLAESLSATEPTSRNRPIAGLQSPNAPLAAGGMGPVPWPGAIAQLEERLHGMQEVGGSSPLAPPGWCGPSGNVAGIPRLR